MAIYEILFASLKLIKKCAEKLLEWNTCYHLERNVESGVYNEVDALTEFPQA